MEGNVPMRRRNVLRDIPRLTQSSYRQAVSETVRHLQDGESDQDFADLWGVGEGTVLNARNRNHDLSSIPLLKLGERFGPDALNTILVLIGAKAVPVEALALDVSSIPCEVAECVPLLIRLLGDNHASAEDIHMLDDAGVIDTLGGIADSLRQHRDRLRLRAVS